ncbi:hypothetical protein [Nonomuraea rubra]|uniref:hypothetical protein n=1 Tax=Nonomuraea rubra TaxID=46180 RepID=UPI003F4D2D66
MMWTAACRATSRSYVLVRVRPLAGLGGHAAVLVAYELQIGVREVGLADQGAVGVVGVAPGQALRVGDLDEAQLGGAAGQGSGGESALDGPGVGGGLAEGVGDGGDAEGVAVVAGGGAERVGHGGGQAVLVPDEGAAGVVRASDGLKVQVVVVVGGDVARESRAVATLSA